MKPLVSILIPSFNHEKYINDCLESILKLDYPRVEVLLIDDASTDQTFEIADAFKEKLERKAERVYIEKNPTNLGICGNYNKLWELARGDYYKFIASDDILLPKGIAYLVDYFEKHPECNIVHGNVVLMGENDTYVGGCKRRPEKRKYVPSGCNLTPYLLEGNFIFAPAVMISKETKKKWGMYSEQYSYEDWEYWLRVSVEGRIDYINQPVVGYRETSNSASHIPIGERSKDRKDQVNSDVCIFELYKSYASKETIFRFYNNMIKRAYLCDNRPVVKMVKDKIKENKVRIPIKTKKWILEYKLGIYKKRHKK